MIVHLKMLTAGVILGNIYVKVIRGILFSNMWSMLRERTGDLKERGRTPTFWWGASNRGVWFLKLSIRGEPGLPYLSGKPLEVNKRKVRTTCRFARIVWLAIFAKLIWFFFKKINYQITLVIIFSCSVFLLTSNKFLPKRQVYKPYKT